MADGRTNPCVKIADREFSLSMSRDKKKTLNRQLGGLLAAVNKVAQIDLDAIAQIIIIGADLKGDAREFVAEAVYDVDDYPELVGPVSTYLREVMALRKADEGNGKTTSTAK